MSRPGTKSFKQLNTTDVLAYVNEWYRFDEGIGHFVWAKYQVCCRGVGERAGVTYVSPEGYMYSLITVNKVRVREHNVVWLIYKGVWPEHELDHIDGNGMNNLVTNLRDVPHIQNNKNMRLNSRNTVGVPGVRWNKGKQKWQARIHHNYKDHWLGLFDLLEDAISARKAAEIELGYHPNHGRIVR